MTTISDPQTPAEGLLGLAILRTLEDALAMPTDLPMPTDSLAAIVRDAVLSAGWRPPAHVVETPEEAEALPARTVVMDSPYPEGDVYQRTSDGHWVEPGFHGTFTTRILSFPVTILYLPADITEEDDDDD